MQCKCVERHFASCRDAAGVLRASGGAEVVRVRGARSTSNNQTFRYTQQKPRKCEEPSATLSSCRSQCFCKITLAFISVSQFSLLNAHLRILCASIFDSLTSDFSMIVHFCNFSVVIAHVESTVSLRRCRSLPFFQML